MKIENCLPVRQAGELQTALAPMAGVTDSAFRLMNKLGGANLVYSEMAHVNAISFNSQKTIVMLKASPFEPPYIVQLFGNDPKYFAEAVKIVSEKGVPAMHYKPFSKHEMEFLKALANKPPLPFYSRFLDFQKQLKSTDYRLQITDYLKPSGLDINLGCPAKKVCGHGSGAALWKNLPKIRAILEAVLANTRLPVSIKVRTAVNEVTVLDLLDCVKDLPLNRVMIHGRSYKQGFSGPIDTKIIKKAIKKYPRFEFWVNGGIVDRKSAQKIIRETGCRNLGIARGTLGDPLLAEEIKIQDTSTPSLAKGEDLPSSEGRKDLGFSPPQMRGSGRHLATEGVEDVLVSCLLVYIHSILAFQSKGRRGILEMRKHLCWYFKNFPGAKDWRKKLVTVKKISEIEKILTAIAKIPIA